MKISRFLKIASHIDKQITKIISLIPYLIHKTSFTKFFYIVFCRQSSNFLEINTSKFTSKWQNQMNQKISLLSTGSAAA